MADPAHNPQSKVNHLVFECLQKAAGIILQARVQSDHPPSGVSERNWFQLNIESVEYVRQYLEPWSTNLHEPIQLDILSTGEDASLVERWVIHYLPRKDTTRERATAISRKIGILLRTLYSYVRILPAFQNQKKRNRQRYDFRLYNPLLNLTAANVEFSESDVGRYSFPLLGTPFGHIHVTARYAKSPIRRDTLASSVNNPSMEPNVIITDYIPDYQGPSRFTTTNEMAGHRRTRSSSVEETNGDGAQPVASAQTYHRKDAELKRANTVGATAFQALARRHSSPPRGLPSPAIGSSDDTRPMATHAPISPANSNVVPLGVAGKQRSGGRPRLYSMPIPIPENEELYPDGTNNNTNNNDNNNSSQKGRGGSEDPWTTYFGADTPPNVPPLGRPHAKSLDATPMLHQLISASGTKADLLFGGLGQPGLVGGGGGVPVGGADTPLSTSPMQAPYGVLPQMARQNSNSKELAFVDGSPSLVSALPDVTEAIVSCSPPFPRLEDCNLLSTSPQTPMGFNGSHMNKYLQLNAAATQRHTKPVTLHEASGKRRVSPDAVNLPVRIVALPDNPFDMDHNLIESKDDDPNGQLPFAAEDLGLFDGYNDSDAAFASSVDGAELPRLYDNFANSGELFRGLAAMSERQKLRSFHSGAQPDALAVEERFNEFRSFHQSLYQQK